MANVDRPNGFRPIGTMTGGSWESHTRLFEADGSGSNIFPGDLVELQADGYVDVAPVNSVNILGACVGVLNHFPDKVNGKHDNFMSSGTRPDLSKRYYDTSAGKGHILVAIGRDILFEAQEDGDGTPLTIADIGRTVDFLATAGNTTTGNSNMELNSDGQVNDTFVIVDFVDRVDNELGSTGARWIVRLNKSFYTDTDGV